MFHSVVNGTRKIIAAKRLSNFCAKPKLTEADEREAIQIILKHLDCPSVLNVVTLKNYNPPIMNALLNGHSDIANTLMSSESIDPNQIGKNKENLLHFLTRRLNKPWCRDLAMHLLERREVDYNAKNSEGATPLILASRQYIALMEPLLHLPDIDVNAIAVNALTGACDNALVALIENCQPLRMNNNEHKLFLLKAGRLMRTLLSLPNIHINEYLPKIGNGHDGFLYEVTALMLAANDGLLPLVKILLHAGANPLLLSGNQLDAAMFAENNGHNETAACIRNFNAGSDLCANSFFAPERQNTTQCANHEFQPEARI